MHCGAVMLAVDMFYDVLFAELYVQAVNLVSSVSYHVLSTSLFLPSFGTWNRHWNRFLNLMLSTEPFLTKLYPYLVANFGTQWYPELTARAEVIQNIIQSEETIFLATLDKGLGLLESVFEQPKLQAQKEIPAETAFKLYDTYGFPLDLTVIIAAERGWHVDLSGNITYHAWRGVA